MMKDFTFNKFLKYILAPDLSNKLLCPTFRSVPVSKRSFIYLRYVFSGHRQYDFLAIKTLILLETIYPKRAHMSSKLIVLKYAKTRLHSIAFLKLNTHEAFRVLLHSTIKPINHNTVAHGSLKEASFLVFPSLIKPFRLPSTDKWGNVMFHNPNSTLSLVSLSVFT